MIDDDSWPVGGTRLRPTFRNDSSWDGIGHVPADWENLPGERADGSEDDWEKLLAAALGITTSGSFKDSDVDAPADPGPMPAPSTPVSVAAPAPHAPPATGLVTPAPAVAPVDPILPWASDDILPNRGNGRHLRRFFRR